MAKEKTHLPLKEISTYVYLRTLISGEKSMPDFKASKHRLTLLWGANTAAVLKLKTMFFYWFESSRALKNYAKSPLCMFCKWNNKAWMTADLFTIWLTEYFKPTVETCTQKRKKKTTFKLLPLIDNVPVTQELWWRYTIKLILLSCLLIQHPLCSPWINE